MKTVLPLLFALCMPAMAGVKPDAACIKTRAERLVEILQADATLPPADMMDAVQGVCKPKIRATRKDERPYSDRVLNGALLREAARHNADATITWALQERKADPNDMTWDNYGHPLPEGAAPLHIAAANGAVEAAEVLLDAGANPNAVDKNGNTPLMLAAASGADRAAEMVDLMLLYGGIPELRNYEGKCAVDMVPPQAAAVFDALCCCGMVPLDKARFEAWLEQPKSHNFSRVPEQELWLALLADDLSKAEDLLKKGAFPRYGQMGVHHLRVAINHGNADMVRLLMRYGAEFPEYGAREYFPWMYSVVLCGNPDILDLVPYYEPKENAAESPLIVALRGRCGVEMAAALLERGADTEARSLNTWRDYSVYNIVRDLAKDEQVDRLLRARLPEWSLYDAADRLQVYLNTPGFFALDKRGEYAPYTPLALFRQDKNDAAVNALLAAGADEAPVCFKRNPQTKKREDGSAPEMTDTQPALMALEQNDAAFFVAMNKADLNRLLAPATCAANEFDLGTHAGRYYMASALVHAAAAGKVDIVRVLLARGADMEQADAFGKSAIVYAAANGHVDCVRLLLNAGAQQHGLALQMAALCGQHTVVDYLLKRGLRPGLAPEYALMSDNPHPGLLSLRKPDVDVALGLAVKLAHSRAVKRFIEQGANVNRPGFYPLHENFDAAVLKVLVEAGADTKRKNKDGLVPAEYHLKHNRPHIVEILP